MIKMCYKVVLKRTVYVDADSPDEAEALALDVDDYISAEDEVIQVQLCGNALYYPYGGA